jgi:hypothetical protein
MVLAGSLLGIVAGIGCVRFIESLLFEVNATGAGSIALPPLQFSA